MAEKDLRRLISGMEPALSEGRYYIGSFDQSSLMALSGYMDGIIGIFTEKEGLSVIFSGDVLEELGGMAQEEPAGPFALITLSVRSDLFAVGLLAEVSRALAKEGIPLNAFSAFHHDHLLVPHGMREKAVNCLERLSRQGGLSD